MADRPEPVSELAEIAEPEPVTIDELAHEVGLPASTIRLYQNRGLLPPPERRGRVGYYGIAHRAHLRLIAHLQAQGFSLAGIARLLDAWTRGHSVERLVGLYEVAPGLRRPSERVSLLGLADRIDDMDFRPEHLRQAEELGLLVREEGGFRVRIPALVESAGEVARHGVDTSTILGECERLLAAARETGSRLAAVLDTVEPADRERRRQALLELAVAVFRDELEADLG